MNLFLEHSEQIIFIMEIIGTIAFASSGALTTIRQDMDIFGINVLGLITAVGGGVIRDLIIGHTPPATFLKPIYAIVAVITCNILFLIFYFNRHLLESHFIVKYEKLMLIMDAIGLGIFSAIGVSAGMGTEYHSNIFLLVFLGSITGVGGGMIRDMMAVQKPYVLVRHVYACASIIGSLVCVLLWPLNNILAMWISAAVVIIIRILAIIFHWNLPRLKTVDK